jgi:hypothetical protein
MTAQVYTPNLTNETWLSLPPNPLLYSTTQNIPTTVPVTVHLDAPQYGVTPGTVSPIIQAVNVVRINAALVFAQTIGLNVIWGPNTYQLLGTVIVPASANSIWMYGTLGSTRVEQYGSGVDTIHWGPPVGNPQALGIYGGGIQGLTLVSMTDQSTVAPVAGSLNALLSITGAAFATFRNMRFGEIFLGIASHNHYCYNALCFDPVGGAYSSSFWDMEVKGFGQSAFNMQATTSGNFCFNLAYRNGGLGDGPLKTSNGPGMIIGNGEGVYDQINAEWAIYGSRQPALYLPSSAGVKVGHFHMEGLQISESFAGARAGFISVPGASMSRFESIHMISMSAPSANNITSLGMFVFGFGGNYSNVSVGQILIAQTSLGVGVNFYFVNTYDGPGAGSAVYSQIDFCGPFLFFGDGSFASKLTGWSDCNFASSNRGPANGLGVPPTNIENGQTLTITTGSPGYSAGTYTQTNLDGASTYLWNAAVNGTINMAQIVDPLLPVSIPMFPSAKRRIYNITAANTVAIHNADTSNILNGATLAAGAWVDIVFQDTTGKWKAMAGGVVP